MELDLDINAILAPFEGESRRGIDLREDEDPNNLYRRVRDARGRARDEERQAEIDGASPSVAAYVWQDVWDLGRQYLETKGKDLEIVAYMVEASIRLGGCAGLGTAVNMLADLIDQYWNDLYPAPDEDGEEVTIQPITRLNGDVITQPLLRIEITSNSASAGPFAVWQYDQAKRLESLPASEREERVARGAATLPQFNVAVAETDVQFFLNIVREVELAKAAVKRLSDVCDAKLDSSIVPNFSKFNSGLDDVRNSVQQLAGDRMAAAIAAAEVVETSGSSEVAIAGSNGRAVGGLGSRNDAFMILEKVAQWFDEHEPQSILPSEIRKAIRRGKMSPVELYQDLIADSDVRRQLFKDVGIPNPEDG